MENSNSNQDPKDQANRGWWWWVLHDDDGNPVPAVLKIYAGFSFGCLAFSIFVAVCHVLKWHIF